MSSALAAPRAHGARDGLAWEGAGYERTFAFAGPAGATVLQEVRTTVRFLCGEGIRVELRSRYGEFFRLGPDGTLGEEPDGLLDVHGLRLRRDGWSQAAVGRLLRRHGLRACRHEARVECRKVFRLGLGEVEGVVPVKTAADRAFGFLASGPRTGPSCALTLRDCDGRRRAAAPPSPIPFGHPAAGRGRFTAARGWRAVERYGYVFPTAAGWLRATPYAPVALRPAITPSAT